MSRSGYSEDCYDDLEYGRWRGVVASATRGKRGQAFFRDLIAALDEMPEKRLIKDELQKENGEVCALGALGIKRKIPLETLDPEDHEVIAATFDIATPLAQEVTYMNDENWEEATPEERWIRMRAWAKECLNDRT